MNNMDLLRGKVWIFGDDIDTDVIIPARYLNTSDPKELARHCMVDVDPEFSSKVLPGDIIVGGKNFGCGSSREHAPLAIKGAGIACVIATNFARIFYRNAINIGLPILESAETVAALQEGEEVEINLQKGEIKILSSGKIYKAVAFPPFMQGIISSGGLINYLTTNLRKEV